MNKITTILLFFAFSTQAQLLKKNDTFLNLDGSFEILSSGTQSSSNSTKINLSPSIEYLAADDFSFFLGIGVSPQYLTLNVNTASKPTYLLKNNYFKGGVKYYFAKKENLAFYVSPNFTYHFISEDFKNQTSYWGGDDGKAKSYSIKGSLGFVCSLNPKLLLNAETSVISRGGIISSDNINISSHKIGLSFLSNAQIGIKYLITKKD